MPNEQTQSGDQLLVGILSLVLFDIKALLGNQVILTGDKRQCFRVLGVQPEHLFLLFSFLNY